MWIVRKRNVRCVIFVGQAVVITARFNFLATNAISVSIEVAKAKLFDKSCRETFIQDDKQQRTVR